LACFHQIPADLSYFSEEFHRHPEDATGARPNFHHRPPESWPVSTRGGQTLPTFQTSFAVVRRIPPEINQISIIVRRNYGLFPPSSGGIHLDLNFDT
jgi:hypothetical protein